MGLIAALYLLISAAWWSFEVSRHVCAPPSIVPDEISWTSLLGATALGMIGLALAAL